MIPYRSILTGFICDEKGSTVEMRAIHFLSLVMIATTLQTAFAAPQQKALMPSAQDVYTTVYTQIDWVWNKKVFPSRKKSHAIPPLGKAIIVLVPSDDKEYPRTFQLSCEKFTTDKADAGLLYTIRIAQEMGWAVGKKDGKAIVYPMFYNLKEGRVTIHTEHDALPEELEPLLAFFTPQNPDWTVSVLRYALPAGSSDPEPTKQPM